MEKWKASSNYMGKDMSEYYILYSQTRDSDTVTRSNFDCILKDIDPNMDTENENSNVVIASFNHWTCGWIETIMIHESDKETVAHGNDIQARLEQYAVYNDLHFCDLEYNEAAEMWDALSLSEKIDYCRQAKISLFAARSKEIPQDVIEYVNYR